MLLTVAHLLGSLCQVVGGGTTLKGTEWSSW